MTDNRRGGIALIVGAVTGIITMVLHPVGGGHVLTPAQFEKLTALMTGVHILGIAGIPFLFLGALALSRHLEMGGRLALATLVVYSLSLVAIMIAPAMSGLVGTEILRRIAANNSESSQWHLLMEYNFLINQAFAKIFVVASCVAIGLWSFLIVKARALPLALGIYGLLISVAIIIAMTAGMLYLDAHGFGLIIFAESIWLIVAGAFLTPARRGSPDSGAISLSRPRTGSFKMFALMVTSCAACCSIGCAQHSLPPPDRVELGSPPFVAMDLIKGVPVVSARLNGKGPFKFILDSGAQASVIAEGTARELGLPKRGIANMGRPGSDKAVAVTVTRLEKIEVGGVTIKGVTAVFADLSSITEKVAGIQGVLSTAMFRGLLVTFDYPEEKIKFKSGELSAEDGQTIFAWSRSETAPRVTVDVAGEQVRLQLDTGATGGFHISSATAARLSWLVAPVETGKNRTVDSESKSFTGRIKGIVQVGKFSFQNPRVSYDDLGLTIGYDILKDFAVTLDQKNRRFALTPAARQATPEGN